MHAKILHIWGDLYINSFGLMITLGILVSLWLMNKDPERKKILSTDKLINIFFLGILISLVGSRVFHFLTDPDEAISIYNLIAIWQPGFSIIGAIVAISIFLPLLLRYYNIPIIKFLDLIFCYTPLLQSISRIGCFFAGCCHGTQTTMPWAIMYSDKFSSAPLGTPLHPTQIYTSIILLAIFLFFYLRKKYLYKISGLITFLYLFLIGLERFIFDFFRADRIFCAQNKYFCILSTHQWASLCLILFATAWFSFYKYKYKKL